MPFLERGCCGRVEVDEYKLYITEYYSRLSGGNGRNNLKYLNFVHFSHGNE